MSKEGLNIGVVGATGMVGETFLKLLKERSFPVKELRLFASEKSAGQKVQFKDQECTLKVLKPDCFNGLDLVFFSSGDEISAQWAPEAVKSGAFAVDNSAAFRMSDSHELVVPEINGDKLPPKDQPTIIANPNCSTIQLVMALHPLKEAFGINEVKVSSYQAVSGGGKAAQEELLEQVNAIAKGDSPSSPQAFPHTIAFNCLPHIGSFNDDGFCSEEMKIMRETRKILNQPNLKVSAFTVRVPSLNGHSEAAWVTLDKEVSKDEIINVLKDMPGIRVVPQDQPQDYPHVLNVSGQGDVFVGRIHQDLDDPKTWIMWIVADNILKGAALNGIQIAEKIYQV